MQKNWRVQVTKKRNSLAIVELLNAPYRIMKVTLKMFLLLKKLFQHVSDVLTFKESRQF